MPDGKLNRRLFTKAEVAAMLNVSLRQVAHLVSKGYLPPPVTPGGPRWTERDLDDCIRRLEIEREARRLSAQAGTGVHTQAKRKTGQNEA